MKFKVSSNPVLNFLRYGRKHGFRKAWRDLLYNYAMLDTPEQQLKKQLVGYVGSMLGLVLAGVVFWFRGNWQLIPVFCFSELIMYANFKSVLKQFYSYQDAKRLYGDELGMIDKLNKEVLKDE